MKTLIHYGELGLKGKNRPVFEKRLAENIKKLAGGRVCWLQGRLVAEGADLEKLKNVFGVAWFAPVSETRVEIGAIEKEVERRLEEEGRAAGRPSFRLKVNRADKNFPLTSPETAAAVGEAVRKRFGLKVDLKRADLTVFVEILADRAFVFFEKVRGRGGLPVGVSGRVLCLLSGGIDSAVAAFLLMKRGCRVDFLHFHTFAENKQVEATKIRALAEALGRYQPRSRLFLAPYYPFQLSLGAVHPGYELVMFRRLMARVGEKIAEEEGYAALATGDSLAQVASQTMENLAVIDEAASLLTFRPLIGFDKEEIISKAKEIGTYDVSIQPYKDCCSIITRQPKTKTKLEVVRRLEQKLGLEEIAEETLKLRGRWEVGTEP
jgi:thiamine biosynthesis protein ThiI